MKMGITRKILLCICLAIFLFILGMMVRRFYDNYSENKPILAGADSGKLHLVIEPAESVPDEFRKAVTAQSGQQAGGLRPPEKKDN